MADTKLRHRLMEDGRPQYVIAESIGVSPARISEYCLGRRAIPTHTIYSLCRELRCNVEDIVGYESEVSFVDSPEFLIDH